MGTRVTTDNYQRRIEYLRISITDRCNERCLYCLPEGFKDWRPRDEILTYEEIRLIVQTAVALGFSRFRITGGEPLVREQVEVLISQLTGIRGVEGISLSTNGTRLAAQAKALAQAGLRSANVSLDAVDAAIYQRITGGRLEDVIRGIEAAQAAGISSLKLNAVLMRGVNEHQIWPLIEFAGEYDLPIRFIELMPVSRTDVLDASNFFPVGEAKALIENRARLVPESAKLGHGPAAYYRLPECGVIVGFIGAMTNLHFCDACNKMRLTADGKIRPCLGNHLEFDLKPALRPMASPELLRQTIEEALRLKPWDHQFRNQFHPERIMTAIGG
jgi:GTP 3',8-cyclase